MNGVLLRLALRFHRTGFVACTVIGTLFGILQVGGFSAAAGSTAEERQIFAAQMGPLAAQMSYMLPLPRRIDTLAGFVQWRTFGILPLVFGFWGLFAAAGAMRTDEESGLVEQWLGAGVSRVRYVVARLVAFDIVAAAAIILTCASTGVAATAASEPIAAAGLAAQGTVLLAAVGALYAVFLLVAQFVTTGRSAAGAGAGVLAVLFFLNSFSRTQEAVEPSARISPFWHYDRTRALLPDGPFDVASALALASATVVLAALAGAAFVRRDLGGSVLASTPRPAPAVLAPSANRLLRLPVLPALYEQRLGLVCWLLGVTAGAVCFASLTRTVIDVMVGTPSMRAYLDAMLRGGTNYYQAFIGFGWFGVLELLVAMYVVTQTARWVSEEGDGRLEMMLSAPVHRWRVPVERGLALAIAVLAIGGLGAVAAGLGLLAQDLPLDWAGLLGAALLLLPVGLALGAVGAAMVSSWPRGAVVTVAACGVGGYLIQQFGLLLRWPQWAMRLSVFELYGSPLARGVYWEGLSILLGITAGGFALAMYGMERHEVER